VAFSAGIAAPTASGEEQLTKSAPTGSDPSAAAAAAMLSPLRRSPAPCSATVQDTQTGLAEAAAAQAAPSASPEAAIVSQRKRSTCGACRATTSA